MGSRGSRRRVAVYPRAPAYPRQSRGSPERQIDPFPRETAILDAARSGRGEHREETISKQWQTVTGDGAVLTGHCKRVLSLARNETRLAESAKTQDVR